jgi:hypothetical protein
MNRCLTAILLAPLLGGCWLTNAYLWAPYRAPAPADFRSVSTLAGCPQVGAQNIRDARHWEAVSGAVAQVCRIYRSEPFAAELRRMRLRATCDRPGGREDWIGGDAVVRLLTGSMENFSVLVRTPINAIAQIDPPRARIAVSRGRVDAWHAQDRTQRRHLINTMAHEMSHFVREEGDELYRFRDGGHTEERPGCPDAELVSYAVGDLVERLWLAEQGQ